MPKLTSEEKTKRAARIALNKAIRAKTAELGWDVWSTYTDGRRVKFARNAWDPSPEVKADIAKAVEELLREHKVDGEVKWGMGESWRGTYPYLAYYTKEA